jgi:hypothetical protein
MLRRVNRPHRTARPGIISQVLGGRHWAIKSTQETGDLLRNINECAVAIVEEKSI